METDRFPPKGAGSCDALAMFQECTPLFLALGDPARQQLIVLLAQTERLNVSQLAASSPLSRPAVSHHLKILRQAGIVKAVKSGTEQYYSLTLEDLTGKLRLLLNLVESECLTDRNDS
ncbi:ArsR/SmtB family transcription factor [Gorillibacterium sp. sgz5001074]|uniref:ArsR/SmtB family transcription factor n=1 Tax=Gorillibacterium sp. sgz5001074 TaxID=3446695 RepID=UPI003F67B12A